jgi:membrane-bound lytic murein transglycosylase A
MPKRPVIVATIAGVAAVVLAALIWFTWPGPAPGLRLAAVGYGAVPGWAEGRQAGALPALARSCQRFARRPDDKPVGVDGVGGTVGQWRAACAALAAVPANDDAAARAYFESWFQAYAVYDGGRREGLFTGYYEPMLRASAAPGGPFRYPLYGKPDDLIAVDLGKFATDLKGRRIFGRIDGSRLEPYFDREAIEAGALDGRGLELYWADNPVDVFFLQIQGSGRLRLPDGSETRIGYAAKNGQPYYAIGRDLIDTGALTRENVSMQTIRAWLDANPAQAVDLMRRNRSYVFFRDLGEGDVTGALGVGLTPGRSLAIDRSIVPLGAPLWLDAKRPGDGPGDADRPLRRLMVAQDTGGAIRGGIRGDVFWGHGARAEHIAGHMKHPGQWYLLLPRDVAPPEDRRY